MKKMNDGKSLFCAMVDDQTKKDFYKALRKSYEEEEIDDAKSQVVEILLQEYIKRQEGERNV